MPGIKGRPNKDWLTAVWGCNHNGDRFQNYKALFSILNTSSGSPYKTGFGINLAWLNDIENGNAYISEYAPYEWIKYINNKNYSSLLANKEKFVKSKEDQLPKSSIKMEMLLILQHFFIEKDRGYSFEVFSKDIAQYIEPAITSLEVTRPYKDGGIDAEGKYKIFSKVENVVYVDFYMQAKCYNPKTTPVTVQDTARLISRIKDRQFGILITTSYIAKQAYEEVLEDGHPIVFINGKNIIDFIFDELEIRNVEILKKWLEKNYV